MLRTKVSFTEALNEYLKDEDSNKLFDFFESEVNSFSFNPKAIAREIFKNEKLRYEFYKIANAFCIKEATQNCFDDRNKMSVMYSRDLVSEKKYFTLDESKLKKELLVWNNLYKMHRTLQQTFMRLVREFLVLEFADDRQLDEMSLPFI